jgi:vaccinia related kinase
MPANDKKVKTTNGYRLPERLPKGEVLNGILGEKWEIGDVIGSGGFGVIYLARSLSSDRGEGSASRTNGRTVKNKASKFDYVIKLDHASGPLFAEMHFYSRVAKKLLIENWLKEKGAFLSLLTHS